MTLSLDRNIVYPDSDGKPMADNTRQFRWIVLFKENLECLFADNPNVFVAGDLLWYPVEGSPDIRVAPDVFVVFDRPKGDRGSYQQWKENNITPQVVFEILSPGNTYKEMVKKQQFYDKYGVEEYYIYDPDRNVLTGLERENGILTFIEDITDWISPRLGIRFVLTDDTLKVYYPDGQPFLTTIELTQKAQQEKLRADQAQLQVNRTQLENDRLRQLLLQAGINIPDDYN
ncbi:Uma2 family endonuclease [Geminocystis sp. CENA526]|uniref:Uma2 family endonuclease n=1 Tax=Geminocystis sp. CENA526 TaxID=1355871 RepID=UPI003D6E3C2D